MNTIREYPGPKGQSKYKWASRASRMWFLYTDKPVWNELRQQWEPTTERIPAYNVKGWYPPIDLLFAPAEQTLLKLTY